MADSSTDWVNGLFGGAALPAPAVLDVNLAISYGDVAYASAEGGNGDFALAVGTQADAGAGGLSTDTGAN